MRARYYDPNVGRFNSEDPQRDAMNWYAYTSNNPINSVDVDGKRKVDLWDWAAGELACSIAFGAICLLASGGPWILYGYALVFTITAVIIFAKSLGVASSLIAAGAGIVAGDKFAETAFISKLITGLIKSSEEGAKLNEYGGAFAAAASKIFAYAVAETGALLAASVLD